MILELLGLFFGKSIAKQVDNCVKEIDNLCEEDVAMIEQLLDDED